MNDVAIKATNLVKKFGIETGDRFLVMGGKRMGAWGLLLVKSDVLSQVIQDMFGGKLEEVLTREGQSAIPREPPEE